MKNNNSVSLQLLALVPHRDVRISLRAWSASLFSKGLCGAWSFPWVMPIAALKRPLSGVERFAVFKGAVRSLVVPLGYAHCGA